MPSVGPSVHPYVSVSLSTSPACVRIVQQPNQKRKRTTVFHTFSVSINFRMRTSIELGSNDLFHISAAPLLIVFVCLFETYVEAYMMIARTHIAAIGVDCKGVWETIPSALWSRLLCVWSLGEWLYFSHHSLWRKLIMDCSANARLFVLRGNSYYYCCRRDGWEWTT